MPLYVDSTGDTYRLEAAATAPVSQITATFEIELARFDATTPATSLVVLYFDQTSPCYVALDYQPTPMRLSLVANCGGTESRDLTLSLPSHTAFVPVTFVVNLAASSGKAQLGPSSAMVPIAPQAKALPPGVIFGFVDPVSKSGARVGFDDLLVVTAP